MSTSNGESAHPHGPLELSDVLNVETNDGLSLAFEVVGILEDPQAGASYAVLRHEAADEDEDAYIVTDMNGNLLSEQELAEEIIGDFLAFAEDENEGERRNGETG